MTDIKRMFPCETITREMAQWLATGERCEAAETIFWRMTGMKCYPGAMIDSRPKSPAQMMMCLRLLDRIPEFKAHFLLMSEVSLKWSIIVERWPTLEKITRATYTALGNHFPDDMLDLFDTKEKLHEPL